MNTPSPGYHLVLLDNNVRPEPLSPGLPYWLFYVPVLPTASSAWSFAEQVLLQSELWTNEGNASTWVRLRLTACDHMCARCGQMRVITVEPDPIAFYLIWYVVRNKDRHTIPGPLLLENGDWHTAYRAHRCRASFFA
jgi:hypothetical protein